MTNWKFHRSRPPPPSRETLPKGGTPTTAPVSAPPGRHKADVTKSCFFNGRCSCYGARYVKVAGFGKELGEVFQCCQLKKKPFQPPRKSSASQDILLRPCQHISPALWAISCFSAGLSNDESVNVLQWSAHQQFSAIAAQCLTQIHRFERSSWPFFFPAGISSSFLG